MKAITTSFRGPPNTRGARIVASDGDGNTLTIAYDHGRVRRFVAKLPDGSTVVSGAARGVDETAEGSARARGLEVLSFPADWSQGRGAGHARNAEIVAAADIVVAFWDGQSRGTRNSMDRAMAARKPLWICSPEGRWTFNDPVAPSAKAEAPEGEWNKPKGWGSLP